MADLTTLAKARQQIFGNDPEVSADAILSQLITSSSAWVEREVGGDVMTGTITETLDGDGSTRMRLKRCHAWRPGRPPTTITSVTVDGTAIPARAAVTALNTNPSGYIYRDSVIDLVGYTFTEGTANVVIVHVSGYATVPTDLEQATLEHVALRYKDRGHIGLDSAAAGGEGMVNYGNAGTLAYIEGVLAMYRVMGFV
jgi:hypothetical protein